GVRVRSPWVRRGEAFEVGRELEAPRLHENTACHKLTPIGRTHYPFPPFMVAALSGVDAAEPTDWIVGSWFMTRYGRVDLQTVLPIGAAVEQVDRTSVRLHLLSRSGLHSVYDPTGQGRMEPSLGFQRNQGLGCAAMVGSHWWVVDPAAGTLRTTDPRGSTIPQER